MRKCVWLYGVLLLFPFTHGSVICQDDEPYYFYHGYDYGTEAVYHPLSIIINSGYGILQYGNLSRKIFDVEYAQGWKNVTWNLGHPFSAIREYGGWGEFLGNEVYPGTLSKKNAQYWPNWQNHFVGGGMNYIEVSEWFRFHGFESPKIYGLTTIMVSHLLNEVVENNAYVGSNVDPIADFYLFNPLGIIFFSIDGIPKFFSQELNMAAWPGQPTFSPWTGTIENQGENYSMKWKLPFTERVSVFYYWGLTGLIGASYKTNIGDNISAGAGLRAKELVDASDDVGGRKLTARLAWNFGVFYDRNNSLLASVFISNISDYKVHANIYPGIFRFGPVSPGAFLAIGEGRKVVSGLSVNLFPLGIATRTHWP